MKIIGTIALTILALVACGSAMETSPTTSSSYTSKPSYQSYQPVAPKVQAPTDGTIPSGEWLVPTEVKPGLYRSAGIAREGFITYCQVSTQDQNGHVLEWKNSGTMGENIMVRVSPNAVTVDNSGCLPFTKIG